jgi:hypothetical protein
LREEQALHPLFAAPKLQQFLGNAGRPVIGKTRAVDAFPPVFDPLADFIDDSNIYLLALVSLEYLSCCAVFFRPRPACSGTR